MPARTESPGEPAAPAPVARSVITAPANVIEALARVEGEIGGIEKKRGGDGGIQYAFRGIDAISTAVQPLFAKNGVIIVPHAVDYSVKEITVNSKPWSDGTVAVTWHIYGPGGRDDMIVAQTVGIGRDQSDKQYPKAMTQAFKNLLLRLLCIGDPDDDTDGTTHERDAGSTQPRAAVRPADDGPREVTPAQELAALFSTLDPETKKTVNAHAKELGVTNVMRSGDKAGDLLAYIKLLGDSTTEAEPEQEEEAF